MRRIWRRKWVVLTVTVVAFLSVGAVAWATTAGGSDEATRDEATRDEATCDEASCGAATRDGVGRALGMVMAAKRGMQERAERGVPRAEMLERLREKMTAQDQALLDELLAKAKEQRERLQQMRQDLRDTRKQLRDLARKYLDARTDTSS